FALFCLLLTSVVYLSDSRSRGPRIGRRQKNKRKPHRDNKLPGEEPTTDYFNELLNTTIPIKPTKSAHGQNPLVDQPNMSKKKSKVDTGIFIYGSRKAMTVTKKSYLKKEWCKTEPLQQVIREEGCLKKTMVNRFCYGQCNSFFIPKSNKKDLESASFKSCSFCKPKRYSWIVVTLTCPKLKMKFKRKRIQRIKECKCMAQKLD
ncbi:unnamed protein product, partial [Owenia fusiformis]